MVPCNHGLLPADVINFSLLPIIQAGFVVVTVAAYGWTLYTFNQGMSAAGFSAERKQRTLLGPLLLLPAWALFISVVSRRGFFSDFSMFPPRMVVVFLVPLVAVLLLTFSKTLNGILTHIPAQNIIRLQVFRVLVEILLWMLVLQKLLPVQMSFEGRNFDVLIGLTAPLVAWLMARTKWSPAFALAWNVAGLLLLFNIVVIAILSMPTPLRYFMTEPANTIVTTFPYIWLPGLLVPLAYALHFFSIRQILTRKKNEG